MKPLLALCVVSLGCWVVMFLAGTDVWHFAGSPDFWRQSDPPANDLRVLGYAFYLQFGVLLSAIAAGIWQEIKPRRR